VSAQGRWRRRGSGVRCWRSARPATPRSWSSRLRPCRRACSTSAASRTTSPGTPTPRPPPSRPPSQRMTPRRAATRNDLGVGAEGGPARWRAPPPETGGARRRGYAARLSRASRRAGGGCGGDWLASSRTFVRVLTSDDEALSALRVLRTTVPPRAATTMRQKPARQPTRPVRISPCLTWAVGHGANQLLENLARLNSFS
jgi:hypothetical protein